MHEQEQPYWEMCSLEEFTTHKLLKFKALAVNLPTFFAFSSSSNQLKSKLLVKNLVDLSSNVFIAHLS